MLLNLHILFDFATCEPFTCYFFLIVSVKKLFNENKKRNINSNDYKLLLTWLAHDTVVGLLGKHDFPIGGGW